MGLIQFISNLRFLCDEDSAVTGPLYKFIDQVGPIAIPIVAMLSIILIIIFGVRYSKAEKTEERQAAQKQLVSFIIGAIVVILLLSILYAIRGPLSEWANS